MTCYFRYLNNVFEKSGINITHENKKEVDRIIHTILGIEYKNCSATWKELKKRIADDQEKFVNKLKVEFTKTLSTN
jgi:hypothetical protein